LGSLRSDLDPVSILLLADSHLGFDSPSRPRVEKPRRGDDFFANYRKALDPALRGEVDVVVHGGDLFYRSQVSSQLVLDAFGPLMEIADSGIPVLVVPGNHERSRIPLPLLTRHPLLHIFDRPRRVRVEVRGKVLMFAGFPQVRDRIRETLPEVLSECGWAEEKADAKFLCFHQCVEGATVGPSDFVFRSGSDVIRGRDLPAGFTAILAGHIHRAQILRRDLAGRPLAAPVIYPGSTERTSFAERKEEKGSFILRLKDGRSEPGNDVGVSAASAGLRLDGIEFRKLDCRPMLQVDVALERWKENLMAILSQIPENAVLRIRWTGALEGEEGPTAEVLRRLLPPRIVLETAWTQHRREV